MVPKLLEGRADDEPIRVWSAGCASGEEPYSVAMLLAEAMGEDDFRERVKIYATDIDEDALAQARQAIYPREALKSMAPEPAREVLRGPTRAASPSEATCADP